MSPPSGLRARVDGHLQSLRDRHLLRVPRVASGIDLCSNDYLGLADHPMVKARAIEDAGLPVAPRESQIVPIILGDTERTLAVAAALQADRFDVRAIRPPTVPVNTARLRISVNVRLTDDQMERFVFSLTTAMQSAAPCDAVSS